MDRYQRTYEQRFEIPFSLIIYKELINSNLEPSKSSEQIEETREVPPLETEVESIRNRTEIIEDPEPVVDDASYVIPVDSETDLEE